MFWLKEGFNVGSSARSATINYDQLNPKSFSKKGPNSEDQIQTSDEGKENQPEPEENENFIIIKAYTSHMYLLRVNNVHNAPSFYLNLQHSLGKPVCTRWSHTP